MIPHGESDLKVSGYRAVKSQSLHPEISSDPRNSILQSLSLHLMCKVLQPSEKGFETQPTLKDKPSPKTQF